MVFFAGTCCHFVCVPLIFLNIKLDVDDAHVGVCCVCLLTAGAVDDTAATAKRVALGPLLVDKQGSDDTLRHRRVLTHAGRICCVLVRHFPNPLDSIQRSAFALLREQTGRNT